ncbi:hypothetical protein Nepgr_019260 [Nepenthes gracilis]|uniref:Bulb-type lectin domain-containing protein n=1 Tax=Nepenthes gracilis TaxID=150966 RepID=A0AAD3SVI9_NEPGR|nr:hypothetical protein Nepgr_019260 [Nepenthes gracilis]
MPSSMGSSSLPVSTTIILFALLCGFSCSEYIYPDFTASNIQFVDKSGAFLFSKNGTFKAAIYNPGNRKNYYLCVIHAASNALIWSANRDNPVSNYGKMVLTLSGITISDEYGNPQWSTPPLHSSVSALFLTEMGNLVLLGQNNISLWDSFHYPTDTIVIGQKLPVGALLVSSVSDYDLSTANYSLSVTTSDAVLRWDGSTYWKLSTDLNSFRNSNYAVEYLAMNRTGLFLFARNGSVVVIQVKLSESDFQTAKLDVSGRFMVRSYSGMGSKREFSGPDDKCGIPFICGRVGLCTDSDAASTSGPICSCPAAFHADPQNTNSCIPSDASLSLPVACSSTVVINGSSVNTQNETYLGLPPGSDYFTNVFMDPVRYGINLSSCKDLCSQNLFLPGNLL